MKILKSGKTSPKSRKFICNFCGCEFVCKENECDIITNGLVAMKFPVCPECHMKVNRVWKTGVVWNEEG